MAITPLFDTVISNSGTVTTETWVDLGAIPSGKQIWFGYATYAGIDKDTQFETRSNNTGTSTGTVANTQLHDFAGAQTGSSVDRDFYQYGNIMTASVVSTGVEHFWIRVTSRGASGAFDYILRYTTL